MSDTASTTEYGCSRIELEAELRKERALRRAAEHECDVYKTTIRELGEKLRCADQELDQKDRLIRSLSDEVHRLEKTVEAFRSGSKFENLRAMYDSDAEKLRRQIRKLNGELAEAYRSLASMRDNWIGVLEDYELQIERERKEHARDIKNCEKKQEAAEKRTERTRERLRKVEAAKKRLKDELEEAEEKAVKLERQVNMNHENSSMTSAACEIKRKKIPNSRVKSGLKPGAQPGHTGHRRTRLEPTETVIQGDWAYYEM